MMAPLAFSDDDWRCRWLVTPRWRRLHRISNIAYQNDERISGDGVSCCGIRGRFTMPGIFSRMDLPRCDRCCRAAGIPAGEGAPFNMLKGTEASA
jgi:hypothetical protein